jgi:hypothetical protein
MLLAYQVDGHGFYWEIYTEDTKTYLFTVEDDEMGDWLAQHRKEFPNEDVMIFSQEPYQIMFSLHIELDKFFGNETYPLEDCEAIHDPMTPLDEFFCEGCKAFVKWTEGKTAGDFYNNPRLWKNNVFLHNEVELVNV